MFRKLVATNNDLILTVIRLVLGVIFFAHGSQMALGWFGGPGYSATMQGFTQGMGIPTVFAFLAICAEFLGGIGLIVGLLGRIAALGIIAVMVVAIVKVHMQNGLFMNWSGHQAGEGYEYHLLAIAVGLVILVMGSGAISIDRALTTSGKGFGRGR